MAAQTVMVNGSQVAKSSLVYGALDELGQQASKDEITKWVRVKYGVRLLPHNISAARQHYNRTHPVNRLLGVPAVNGAHPKDMPYFTKDSKEAIPIKPVPVAGSNVVEVIKLARLAIEAAGSKDNLKQIIDVL